MSGRLDDVSRETKVRLRAYVDLLTRWNSRVRLVSSASLADAIDRHVADSLQLAPFLPSGVSRAADVGSGAGLPGLVLAIATSTPFLLIESDRRKAAFLQEASRLTHAPVEIAIQRVEAVSADVDVVTSRAFADITTLLGAAVGLIRESTTILLLKGRDPRPELEVAAAHWIMEIELQPSVTRRDSHVVVLRQVRPRTQPSRLPSKARA